MESCYKRGHGHTGRHPIGWKPVQRGQELTGSPVWSHKVTLGLQNPSLENRGGIPSIPNEAGPQFGELLPWRQNPSPTRGVVLEEGLGATPRLPTPPPHIPPGSVPPAPADSPAATLALRRTPNGDRDPAAPGAFPRDGDETPRNEGRSPRHPVPHLQLPGGQSCVPQPVLAPSSPPHLPVSPTDGCRPLQ